MAYYRALLEGNPSVEQKAWKLLQEQRNAIGDDEKALDAFGNLSAERGDSQAAEAAFQQVLKMDARDLTALSNLGILRAKQGNLPSAISLLQSAFDANKDIAGLAMNLARVQCMAGDAAAARATLEAALVYGPGLRELRNMHDRMSDCGAPKSPGAAHR